MLKRIIKSGIFTVPLFILLGCLDNTSKSTEIFVASSFYPHVKLIVDSLASDKNIIIHHGASGSLYNQLKLGQSPDLIILNHKIWTDKVKSEFTFHESKLIAKNYIALVGNDSLLFNIKDPVIGIGDSSFVPLGKYSNTLMKRLSTEPQVNPNYLATNSASQLKTLLNIKEINYAMIYTSQITTEHVYWCDDSTVIDYKVFTLNSDPNTKSLFRLITSDKAKKLISLEGTQILRPL